MPKRSAVSTWHISYIQSYCIWKPPSVVCKTGSVLLVTRSLAQENVAASVRASFNSAANCSRTLSSVCVDFVLILPKWPPRLGLGLGFRAVMIIFCVQDMTIRALCVFSSSCTSSVNAPHAVCSQSSLCNVARRCVDGLRRRAESWRHIDRFPPRGPV